MIGPNTQKILCYATIIVVLSSLSLFVLETSASPTFAKIMPLGDSITVGYNPDYSGLDGYRKPLYQNLIDSHFLFNFVGSQNSGTGLNYEAYSGYEANQIRDNVTSWLVNNPADIVLLHIGTNDIETSQSVSGIILEVNDTLTNIDHWESDTAKSITVILARIILRGNGDLNEGLNNKTHTFNAELQTLAMSRIAKGDRIVVVDMENALSYPSDISSDGIHPNQAGYAKMAGVWYNALVKILGYSLTVNYVGQGMVTKLPDQLAYPDGAVVNLTAIADEGWTFSSWGGDLVGSVISQNITMDNNKTVTATFKPMYKLTIAANYGTTTPSVGEHWYEEGTTVNISASPPTTGADERFSWLNWTGSGLSSYNGTSNNITITMNSSITETAFWSHEYKLTISSNSGTTNPPVGEHWYEAGTPVTITASPPTSADIRASWAGWTGSGANNYTGYINPITLTLNAPVTETASWNIEYKLTVTTNLGATQPPAGENWFAAGTIVTVETSPPTAQNGVQYVCSGWTGTGSVPATGIDSSLVFTLDSPSSISWTWITQYYLTVSSLYGNPDGAGWYDAGTSAYAAVSPTTAVGTGGTHYSFSGWSGSASGTTSTSNPIVMDDPKTATANWVPIQTSTPTPSPLPTPKITPSSSPTASPTPTNISTPTASATPSNKPDTTPTQNNFGYYPYVGLGIGVTSIVAIVAAIVVRKKKKSVS